MSYHPIAFIIGWRDVAAAWIVCACVAAVCFGLTVFRDAPPL